MLKTQNHIFKGDRGEAVGLFWLSFQLHIGKYVITRDAENNGETYKK